MIYNCDDLEQVLKVDEMIAQNIKERKYNLNQEDFQIFSQLRKRIKVVDFAPSQILNKYTQARVLDQSTLLRNQLQYIKIQQNEDSNSDTLSLSIISDEEQFNLIEQQQWLQILNQYETLFKEYDSKVIVKTNKSLDYFLDCNKYVQQNYNNNVYLGLLIKNKEWIVVKEQELCNQSLMDAAQQFVIHNQIYLLYPNKFLKIYLPVYIQIENEKLKFISFSEQGLIDLYQYSQKRSIPDQELQLIFQQVFEQIQLLHKNNIAHRDIKPQNIIFVDNKGWVLCDFEHSLNYINVNGVYDIKGTYAFLLPQQQFNSKIQGVQLKQNLLQNDLYALVITLIVIKYSIKTQEQIEQYLNNPKDQIVEVLLQQVQLEDLQKNIFKYEIKFIRPQLKLKQQEKQAHSYQNQQIIEFLIILDKLQTQISSEYQIKYLSEIDEILKQTNQQLNYLHIVCYQEIPQYVDQLKNIIKYKQLRQRKYWKNITCKSQLISHQEQQLNLIYFMYNIGLTDLVLYTAQQFIKVRYDFSIHLMMIDQLHLFRQYQEAQNQFNILLKNRDFFQMNKKELELFLQYAVGDLYEYLPQQEIDYFKQLGIKFKYMNILEFLINHYYEERFLEQVKSYIGNVMKDKKITFQQRFFTVQELVYDVITVKNLQISLKLLEELKQKLLKFQCPTVDWQDLIKMIVQFRELLTFNNNRKLIKNMNYVIIFNSESNIQQDLLKFYKHAIQLYINSSKNSFRLKIIHKCYLLIKNLSNGKTQLYLHQTMLQLLSVIEDAYNKKHLFQFYFILVYVYKKMELLSVLNKLYQEDFEKLIIICFENTKNYKRLNKLLHKDKLYLFFNQRNLVQYNEFKILSHRFLLNQYLNR